MPALCYPEGCPPYKWPTPAEVAQANADIEKRRDDAIEYIDEITIDDEPETEVEKCRRYCREVAKAEAEKCRRIRENAAILLKTAGCPSRVVPFESSKKKKGSSSSGFTAKKTSTSKSCKTC